MVGEDTELAVLIEGAQQKPSYAGFDEGPRPRTELQPLCRFHVVRGYCDLVRLLIAKILVSTGSAN